MKDLTKNEALQLAKTMVEKAVNPMFAQLENISKDQKAAKRKLKNLEVQYISLVKKGANGKTIIWKSDEAPAPGNKESKKITIPWV